MAQEKKPPAKMADKTIPFPVLLPPERPPRDYDFKQSASAYIAAYDLAQRYDISEKLYNDALKNTATKNKDQVGMQHPAIVRARDVLFNRQIDAAKKLDEARRDYISNLVVIDKLTPEKAAEKANSELKAMLDASGVKDVKAMLGFVDGGYKNAERRPEKATQSDRVRLDANPEVRMALTKLHAQSANFIRFASHELDLVQEVENSIEGPAKSMREKFQKDMPVIEKELVKVLEKAGYPKILVDAGYPQESVEKIARRISTEFMYEAAEVKVKELEMDEKRPAKSKTPKILWERLIDLQDMADKALKPVTEMKRKTLEEMLPPLPPPDNVSPSPGMPGSLIPSPVRPGKPPEGQSPPIVPQRNGQRMPLPSEIQNAVTFNPPDEGGIKPSFPGVIPPGQSSFRS